MKFQASKGNRVKSYSFWFLEPMGEDLYKLRYNSTKQQWEYNSHLNFSQDEICSGISCHSLKAALRHIKKHDEIPKGIKFRLVSVFVGVDIILTK